MKSLGSTPKNCSLGLALATVFAFASGTAQAQDSGFFSGLRLGQPATAPVGALSFAPPGLKLGQALEFSRPADASNPLPNPATAFGGYQFGSGLSLGAALNSSTTSSPFAVVNSVTDRAGVGLKFDAARWTLPASASSVNVDVVSAFNVRNHLSVYGKVGVGRTDLRPGEVSFIPGQPAGTSLTYGIGVRYDFTQNVGLKFELSRGTRFGFGSLRTNDEPDSLNLGIRWSF
jgi:opacity protein-like surface antigen